MILYPAIDLKDGNAVRLVHGDMDQSTVFNDNPAAQARAFVDAGCAWLHLVDLNGAFYCCHSVLPMMQKQQDGLIINISSWAGRYVSRVSGGAYSAAKHALNAMTESINQEYCADGIRACAICPGEVATEILDARPVPVSTEDRSRMVQAEDLGDLILHVCRTPAHVCLNEITISPTWNRGYIGR